jgi:hypothetical protein
VDKVVYSHPCTDLLPAFAQQRLLQGFPRILSTTGQGKTLAIRITRLAQQ